MIKILIWQVKINFGRIFITKTETEKQKQNKFKDRPNKYDDKLIEVHDKFVISSRLS